MTENEKPVPTAVVAHTAGITTRQLRKWVERGYVKPSGKNLKGEYLWFGDAIREVVLRAYRLRATETFDQAFRRESRGWIIEWLPVPEPKCDTVSPTA
ncbi:MAG: hypothetical protein K8U57_06745 [Planctomycetes bacterium]|nr:hypothetical protein [Planctomycetota bacterium]